MEKERWTEVIAEGGELESARTSVIALGFTLIGLEEELNRVRPSVGVTASRAVVLDRNIGRLRERIVFLQRKMAERGKPVDFLEEVEVATERALKEIIALSDLPEMPILDRFAVIIRP